MSLIVELTTNSCWSLWCWMLGNFSILNHKEKSLFFTVGYRDLQTQQKLELKRKLSNFYFYYGHTSTIYWWLIGFFRLRLYIFIYKRTWQWIVTPNYSMIWCCEMLMSQYKICRKVILIPFWTNKYWFLTLDNKRGGRFDDDRKGAIHRNFVHTEMFTNNSSMFTK